MKFKLIDQASLADIIEEVQAKTNLPFDEVFLELEEDFDSYNGGEKLFTYIVVYTEEK